MLKLKHLKRDSEYAFALHQMVRDYSLDGIKDLFKGIEVGKISYSEISKSVLIQSKSKFFTRNNDFIHKVVKLKIENGKVSGVKYEMPNLDLNEVEHVAEYMQIIGRIGTILKEQGEDYKKLINLFEDILLVRREFKLKHEEYLNYKNSRFISHFYSGYTFNIKYGKCS